MQQRALGGQCIWAAIFEVKLCLSCLPLSTPSSPAGDIFGTSPHRWKGASKLDEVTPVPCGRHSKPLCCLQFTHLAGRPKDVAEDEPAVLGDVGEDLLVTAVL